MTEWIGNLVQDVNKSYVVWQKQTNKQTKNLRRLEKPQQAYARVKSITHGLTSLHSIVMMKIAWERELCSFMLVALKQHHRKPFKW